MEAWRNERWEKEVARRTGLKEKVEQAKGSVSIFATGAAGKRTREMPDDQVVYKSKAFIEDSDEETAEEEGSVLGSRGSPSGERP